MPQSWNRYAYTLNNPLRYVDPTGLFEWDATLRDDTSLDSKERERRRKLRDAFTNARNKARADADKAYNAGKISKEKYDAINDALNSYGAEGEKNGVTVGIGTKDGKPGSTDPIFPINEKWNGVTSQIEVKFDEKFLSSGSASIAVAHEGAHVQDALIFANYYNENKGYELNDPRNATQYATENRAFHVQSYLFQAMGKNDDKWGTWNKDWTKVDKSKPELNEQTRRQQAIDKVIKDGYGWTPDNQGWHMSSRTCRPCQ